MKKSLIHHLFFTNLVFGGMALLFGALLPDTWASVLWLLLGFALAAGAVAYVLAGQFTKRLTTMLERARPEDLAAQTLYEELRPVAERMLEERRSLRRALRRQNNTLRREYEKQDRMRRDFTANVSHELKTPLTSISGYAEILRDGLVKPEDIPRFSGKIYDETQRLIALVEDILRLSQLDEGHLIREERLPLALAPLCRSVLGRLQGAAEQKGVQLVFGGGEGNILGIPRLVEEILHNLVDNAIKYNRPQGEVLVYLALRGDRLALCVRDSGIGIGEEERARIFERFYRVDKSHSKEIGGTGLGLSIVKHGAIFHDARIELDSKLGEGSEFRVLFPCPGQEAQSGGMGEGEMAR